MCMHESVRHSVGTLPEKGVKRKLKNLNMKECSTHVFNSELALLTLNPLRAEVWHLQPHVLPQWSLWQIHL